MTKETPGPITVQDVIEAKKVAEGEINLILQEFRNNFGFDVSSVSLYKWGGENCVDVGLTLPEEVPGGISMNDVIRQRQTVESKIEVIIDNMEDELSIIVDTICLRVYPAPVITLKIELPSKEIREKSKKNNFFQNFLKWF